MTFVTPADLCVPGRRSCSRNVFVLRGGHRTIGTRDAWKSASGQADGVGRDGGRAVGRVGLGNFRRRERAGWQPTPDRSELVRHGTVQTRVGLRRRQPLPRRSCRARELDEHRFDRRELYEQHLDEHEQHERDLHDREHHEQHPDDE